MDSEQTATERDEPGTNRLKIARILVLGLALAILAWHSPKLIEAMGEIAA